jgi:hypothetical protein
MPWLADPGAPYADCTTTHVSDAELAGYAQALLRRTTPNVHLETHLADCARCQERLATVSFAVCADGVRRRAFWRDSVVLVAVAAGVALVAYYATTEWRSAPPAPPPQLAENAPSETATVSPDTRATSGSPDERISRAIIDTALVRCWRAPRDGLAADGIAAFATRTRAELDRQDPANSAQPPRDLKLFVVGLADGVRIRGQSSDANLKLADDRARVARQALVAAGIPEQMIVTLCDVQPNSGVPDERWRAVELTLLDCPAGVFQTKVEDYVRSGRPFGEHGRTSEGLVALAPACFQPESTTAR